MIYSVLAVALLLNLTPLDRAQEPPPEQDEPAQVDDVVVHGQRLEEITRQFTRAVAAPARGRGAAVWRDRICVGAVNIRAEAAQYIVDRVSTVAQDLGVATGPPGCRPNVFIIGAADAAGMITAAIQARPRNFVVGAGGMDRGYSALNETATADRPVLWWHVSLPVMTDSGHRAVRLPGEPQVPYAKLRSASRLNQPIHDELQRVIIVFGVDGMQGATLEQLADYFSMVALAQVDPYADTSGFDTVLNLFSETSSPGLTDWDWAYLRALYAYTPGRLDHGDVADEMMRRRRADSPED